MQMLIELLSRGEIVAERLFDDHASPLRAARLHQVVHHRSEEHWRNRQVVRWGLRSTELLANRVERRSVVVIAVDVAQ
jgi:hypothetical protein